MVSWFMIGIEWKIEVIFIEIYLIKLAKFSRKMRKISHSHFSFSHFPFNGNILKNEAKVRNIK
jgi:hypothetical protein